MNDLNLLRKYAMELQTTNQEEVVKVAGIVSKIKNFFKWITDSEYRNNVKSLKDSAEAVQDNLKTLNQAAEALEEAISNGDLEAYNQALEDIKSSSIKVYNDLSAIKGQSEVVRDALWNYTREEAKNATPEFINKFKSYLPENFGLELNKKYNVPFKSVEWYKDITPDQIKIRQDPSGVSAFGNLIKRTKERLKDYSLEDILDDSNNIDQFIKNFKQAIIDGNFVMVMPKMPSSTHTASGGQTSVHIVTASFAVPQTDIELQASVFLIDQRTSHTRRDVLSLEMTHYVTVIRGNRRASLLRFEEIKKIALSNPPRKLIQYKYSDIEMANILKEGYKKTFGQDPTLEVLGFGWAQACLESGRNPTKLNNNNIGNIKAFDDWIKSGKPYFVMSTRENTAEGQEYDLPGAKWAAFDTPEEGAAAYWKLIGNKFDYAMPWIEAGDAVSGAAALRFDTYYTADIERYSGAVGSLFKEFMKKIAPNFSNLESSAKSIPKIPIKQFKDYSAKEIAAIKNYKQIEEEPSEDEVSETMKENSKKQEIAKGNQEAEQLYHKLFSSALPSIINRQILKQNLPTSNVLVTLLSNASVSSQLFYAQKTAEIIRRFADATVTIHADNNNVELQVSTLGSPLVVCNSIKYLCDCMSKQYYKTSQIKVDSAVTYNFLSKYAKISLEDLNKNQRKVYLQKTSSEIL